MSFEALSCAIARVIVHYHAYQTQRPLLFDKGQDTLENMLNCKTRDIEHVLKLKIDEATVGTNSSRLTLLQYMHFGISRAQQAECASTPEGDLYYQTELTEFIRNLQRLLTSTSFWTRTLNVQIDQGQTLDVYLLTYTSARAKTLLLDLFKAIELSPESSKQAIEHNIIQRYQNCTLRTQNRQLKIQFDFLNQQSVALTAEAEALTKRKIKPAAQPQHRASILIDCDLEGFEYVSFETGTEKEELVIENEELTRCFKSLEHRIRTLEKIIADEKKKHIKKQSSDKNVPQGVTSRHANVTSMLAEGMTFFSRYPDLREQSLNDVGHVKLAK